MIPKLDIGPASLRALLIPQRCLLCHAALGFSDHGLCPGCHADLPWLGHACPSCATPRPDPSPCPACLETPPPQDAAWSAFHFEGTVRHAVLALKYSAGFAQGRWLAHAMAGALAARPAPLPERLLPVPLHSGRLRRRGYNQALELARLLGRELALDVDAHALRRIRATVDQIGQSGSARRRNLRGAFSASSRLAGRHVAVVDDVMTTGSTLAELARCCRAAGATTIEVWAVARA